MEDMERVPVSRNNHDEQPNIDSTEQLLADISEKTEAKDLTALKELLPDIQEKIQALREAQEHLPNATNIRSAIARLSQYREEIQAATETRH
ncbi:MAG: hypothetical protein Q7R58_02110 [bacterium]|nr:hypothetical protein [bacterium]